MAFTRVAKNVFLNFELVVRIDFKESGEKAVLYYADGIKQLIERADFTKELKALAKQAE